MKQLQVKSGALAESFDAAAVESQRVPLRRKVILKFHHFGGFFVEYSANISLTGMFIKTDSPKPPGSVFIFEIWLGEEYKLVHGLGEVVWLRDEDDGPDDPAGMGVRFIKMRDDSQAVVERIIAEHVQKGGEIFDLDSEQPAQGPRLVTPREDLGSHDRSIQRDGAGDLLSLDEEDLHLDVLVRQPECESESSRGRSESPGRFIRLALLLTALATALGGLAYMVSADLMPF